MAQQNIPQPTDIYAGEHALDAIFKPRNVAVIGATETQGSVGRTLVWNLLSNPFGGAIFPVNPKRPAVMGIKAYPSVKDIPDAVDLAVICTPPPSVPGVISECVDKGVRGSIIISAGFKEVGPQGVELERQVMEQARRGNMRIIGPNCLGVMNTSSGLNATFAAAMARPGNVAFLSQSGALCTAVLDWSLRENVGFSHFISVGSMLDVDWGDLIYYLGDDPRTNSIVMYMETIGNARSFMSAAREVTLNKPIIIIKPGRTEGAAKAAASHTGSLTGSDDVVDAAFRRAGVLRVNDISELFSMSEALGLQPRPKGKRLTIVTNAGGPGVLATDALVGGGGELTPISEETIKKLNEFLPAAWSHGNPVDVLGDAPPERYAKTLELTAKDPNSDGVLVILSPQAMTDPTATAEQLKPYAKSLGKPVLASWMGGADVAAGENILHRAGIPTFEYPDMACHTFNHMWQLQENLRNLYHIPDETEMPTKDAREQAEALIESVRSKGRTVLTEAESKELLKLYGIPVTETLVAKTADEAVAHAQKLGYPVVLKIHSELITHKTDVGGVKLNLKNSSEVRKAFADIFENVDDLTDKQVDEIRSHAPDAVKNDDLFLGVTVQPMIKLDAYEVILGSSVDPQFGPVLLFGSGGQLVEVYKDRALGLPPLNTNLAHRMVEQTQIYKALKGVRGRKPCDMDALYDIMVRFAQLVGEQRFIKELDINPLLLSYGEGQMPALALDARVVLYPQGLKREEILRPAIRPYPSRFVSPWALKDGTPVTIRPIRGEDEPMLVDFHKSLSEQSVYLRYFTPMKLSTRISHERLSRICFNDYDRELALVVEKTDPASGEKKILGVGRLIKSRDRSEGEYGILIRDDSQRQGMGSELLRRLVEFARAEGMSRITADILSDNIGMKKASEKVGFTVKYSKEEEVLKSELKLK
ncbi:MAG TPA: bifunctional acetate--CoA ligase family protein/GNAT family N-acetyltransferase [Thermoflexales bacterium]|nr:bifunctional acetate--CoA ligase family protein/GNAT family N-acetyltransferase [Thermoflexales bacterium]HQW36711.1 bifunctional acetate--CoA ligase family protein/GNAT family N-acetyltransferase [Thermoflexales bacterium]HQZ20923.1 bifunctional acetate--CoA ligase family protein/GNAT family N-acetyltransferase [Thermoflexales bacterium]